MHKVMLGCACLILSSCAGMPGYDRILEQNGALTVRPSNTPGSDYEVTLRNVVDFGYNPDNPESRREMALRAVSDGCRNARIVNEKSLKTGEYLGGRDAVLYYLYVKCSS